MKNPRKKIFLIILIVVLLIVAVVVFMWYNNQKKDDYPTFIKPRIEMSVFKIKKFTQEITDMDMTLLIDNPLPAGIQLDSLRYKIYIAGIEVIKSAYPSTVQLKANDTSYITFPVIMKNEVLTAVLKKLENKNVDSTEYKITGSASISFSLIKNKYHEFNFSKVLPLYIIPKIKVEKIKLKKLGLKHTKLLMTIEIDNPNVFPYQFKETSYSIKIDNDHLVSGTIDSTIIIPAKQKIIMNLPADVSLSEAMETGFDSWFNAAKTEYTFFFDTKIVSRDNAIKDSKVILQAKGNLKDLKN